MKIGLVFDDSLDRNDGVQQYVRTLGSWLQTQGHSVHYLVGQTQTTDKSVHSLSKNMTMRFNGNRFTIPLYASSRAIRLHLKDEQYDLLHIQMPYSPIMAGKIIKAASPRTAVVGTFHILPVGRRQTVGNLVLGRLQRRSLRRLDACCAVSAAAANFARQAYGLQAQTIPNLINTANWRNRTAKVPGKVVFLGRLVPRKGCKQLLLSLGELPQPQRNRLKVIVAGSGPQQAQLEKMASQLALNVTFTGYISEASKKTLLGSADFAVFPSTGGESFGIVLLEAMAAGSGVVIGGDNPGYRSVLGEVTRCIIDFRRPKTAALQLSDLLQNKNLQIKLHAKQGQIITRYDTAIVGQQIFDMYETAIHKRQQEISP